MGMFQKVNDWLADKGDRFARGGDANRTPNGAYYASSEAEQAYGGMRAPVRNPAPSAAEPANTPPADPNDKYDGRVPYKSQKDLQAEAETRRQQMEDQARRQQAAQQQRQAQPFGRVPAQQAAYPQAQGNVVPFPGMIRGPEGRLYAHVEYVVLLRSRNECTKVIEYIKANASVFLNMEFIANDSERQRCVDMLSGAAYTLGCALNKISQRGIYLISSPSVRVEIDPALQKFASVPEAQGYVRPEYAAYGGAAGYGARAPAYASQGGGYAAASGARAAAYAAQGASGYGAHAAQPAPAGRGG
ncbi:MAG: cell division protein SepF, partial [Clostridiales bacterium]|nr:cell division protein SepF [Clostridiales bacterium]